MPDNVFKVIITALDHATGPLKAINLKINTLTSPLRDVGKGVAAALIGARWGTEAMLLAAGAAMLGHMFPVWLGFRGGKGVATALGVLAVVAWPVALIGGVVWLAMAVFFRISSLAALVAAVVAAGCAAFIVDGEHELLVAGIAVLVIAKHHENIRRLITGTESRISFTKSRG